MTRTRLVDRMPFGGPAYCLVAALAAAGCSEEKKVAPSVSEPPVLNVMHPQIRKITRVVGQPSFVQAYERTSVYPKMTAYIEKWNVDIGDKVQKGDVLADLFVPELREEWASRKASVEYDRERVRLAQKDVEVARADVEAARARLKETEAILGKYEAEVKRWEVQVNRIAREVERHVIAPQILLESQNELKADIAAREAAKATIAKARAELQADEAALARAEVNVGVARADLSVAESEAKRLEAEVGYLKLFAPFDGIIVARNANSWDFVLPRTGDPTAEGRAPHLSPDEQAAPIYVVDRTDIVRIYVDIPERDANFIQIGSDARVKLWAYRDEWIPASVTRLAWALNTHSRTMRAEIDLPNSGGQILPGMYAYGKVVVDRPERQGPAQVGLHPRRRQVVRLAVRERPGDAHRGRDRGSRRAVDRGHEPSRRVEIRDRGAMGAVRALGAGAPGAEALDPHRRRAGARLRAASGARGRIAGRLGRTHGRGCDAGNEPDRETVT